MIPRLSLTETKKTNIFVLLIILAQIAVSFLEPYISAFLPDFYPALQISYHLMVFGIPIALYLLVAKEGAVEPLSLRKAGFANILVIVLISFAMQPVLSVFSFLGSLVFKNNVASTLIQNQQISTGWMLLSMAFFPAVLEELCYRGIVLHGYRRLSPLKACVMSGFLFGLMHFSAQQFLYAFFFGIILGYFVYKTGSIFASIVSHLTINASQILFSRLLMNVALEEGYPLADSISSIDQAGAASTLFYLFAAVLFVSPFLLLFFWIFEKLNKDNPILGHGTSEKGGERAFDASVAAIIILYIAIAIVPELMFYISGH